MEPAQAVLQFLRSVGPSSEAEFYLDLFRSRPRESFAVVAVDEASLDATLDGVALDLRLLHALDLTPIVVLGLEAHARAEERASRLCAMLEAAGQEADTHVLGEPNANIANAAAAGRVPIVAVRAPHDADQSERGVDEPTAEPLDGLAALLRELCSHKLIFVRQRGGLRPRGERLSVVNLSTDYDALSRSRDLEALDRALLSDVRSLLFERVDHRLMVSVTSPINLLHELFTVKGAGTLLRKGAKILHAASYAELDLPRLDRLLRSSFDAAPKPELYARPIASAHVEEDYRGAALLTECPLGRYLTKFAVDREAQGEGLGQDLWNALRSDCPSLIWRARRGNPIRRWYERICEGRFETEDWTVYTLGVAAGDLAKAVEFALSQPLDFG